MKRYRAIALLMAAALVFAACGSDDNDDEAADGRGSASAPPTTITPDGKKAAGEPVKLGFITSGKTATVDTSAEEPGARAAVAYANDYLGGIAGRPVELEVCEDGNTPTGATDCVDELARAGAVAILQDVSPQSDAVLAASTKAGLPFFIWGTGGGALLAENTSVILNALATTVFGPVGIFDEAGATHIGVANIDVPTTRASFDLFYPPAFESVGMDLDVEFIPPAAPDMSPQIQSLIGKGADGLLLIGVENWCTQALKAVKTLGFQGPVVIAEQCLGASIAKSVPGGLEGIMLATMTSPDESDPEVALFRNVLETYEPSANPDDGLTQGSYGVVLSVVRAAAGLTGEITADTLAAAVKAADPQPFPLNSEIEFQCNRQQVAITPSVCTGARAVSVVLDAAGGRTDPKTMDLTDIAAAVIAARTK